MRISVAGVTDISDRAARIGGRVAIADGGFNVNATVGTTAGDAEATGNNVLHGMAKLYGFNGTTWDRVRNLQAGGPKFHLGVGDPRAAVIRNGRYYGLVDFARANAAINQFVVYRIHNPAASGVTVHVTLIVASHSAARRFSPQDSATAGANRTTLLTARIKRRAAPAASAVVSLDNNVAANLGLGVHGRLLQANVPIEYVEPLAIDAGFAMDVQIGDVGNAAGETSTFSVEWYEEA